MKTITITVQVNNNDESNSSSTTQATFDNTPSGIAQAMLLLGNQIDYANAEEIVHECLAEA